MPDINLYLCSWENVEQVTLSLFRMCNSRRNLSNHYLPKRKFTQIGLKRGFWVFRSRWYSWNPFIDIETQFTHWLTTNRILLKPVRDINKQISEMKSGTPKKHHLNQSQLCQKVAWKATLVILDSQYWYSEN